MPLYAAFVQAPRMHALQPHELPGKRRRAYATIALHHWLLSALLLTQWLRQDRPLDELGFRLTLGPGFWAAAGLVLLVFSFLGYQRRRVRSDPELTKAVRETVRHIGWLLPSTRAELRRFRGVALTAGVCEELFFRGFLLAYLDHYLPTWAAWLAVVLWFGLGHAYQGWLGVLQTGVAGALFLTVRLLSGSLYLAMVFHAGLDMHSGALVQWARAQGAHEQGAHEQGTGVRTPAMPPPR